MIFAATAALIAVGSYALAVAILIVDLFAVLHFLAARWTGHHYATLTENSLHMSFGFGPGVVIPYGIISEIRARPPGFFTPEHVSLK